MQIKLNFKDRQEIEKIIAAFDETDNERIYEEVAQMDRQFKSNPVTPVLRSLCDNMNAFDLAADTSDFQERLNNALWDSLTDYVKHQYALQIFMGRHSFNEVA
ncbi:hypothetical protein [Mixta calida]|uniref:hypothetical protein n=1 Tax=Mixta calida TaxID=665913 RepID=UPI0034D6F33E